MRSNASLLSILTVDSSAHESVVFLYLKELHEIAPPDLIWYDKRGKDGHSKFLWEAKKLRQWCIIGEDKKILEIFHSFVNNQKYTATWPKKNIEFICPVVKKKEDLNNFMIIDSICPCERNEYPLNYTCTNWDCDISFLINEQNNCNYIEGYVSNTTILPMKPYGLVSKNLLFEKLKERVCAMHKRRGVYYSVSGDKKNSSKDPLRVMGFVQADAEFRMSHLIHIRDIEGQQVIGKSEIDPNTGKWSAELEKPAGKGQFLIFDKGTSKYLCGEKFYFIKDFSLNTQIVSTILVDFYGRDINLTGVKEEKNVKVTSWSLKSAPTDKEGEIELSDRISEVLLSLGHRIVINDPYFLGELTVENDLVKLSKSQMIFLNALIIAMAKGGIEELAFVGSWKRAKNFVSNKQSMIKNYKLLYSLLKKNFKGTSHFKVNRFDIAFSNQPFHDRYWLSLDKDVTYHVSNSLNGIFDSGELRIDIVEGIEALKIRPQINDRLNDKISLI